MKLNLRQRPWYERHAWVVARYGASLAIILLLSRAIGHHGAWTVFGLAVFKLSPRSIRRVALVVSYCFGIGFLATAVAFHELAWVDWELLITYLVCHTISDYHWHKLDRIIVALEERAK